MVGTKARFSTAKSLSGVLALALGLGGCSTLSAVNNSIADVLAPSSIPPGQEGTVSGFLGGVVADEPQAALAGRAVLSAGGTAADAVTAMGFTLAVTLPSRAGLGSSGACLAYDPDPNSAGGVTPEELLKTQYPEAKLGPLPASTTFGAVDQNGRAVMCAVSMGNLFGTGRIAPGTGILMAASPAKKPQPLLSVVMLTNGNAHAFHGMSGGSGQEGAPVAAVGGVLDGLSGRMPATPPEPGRANVLVCTGYLPKNNKTCAFSTDPRGFGLATGSY